MYNTFWGYEVIQLQLRLADSHSCLISSGEIIVTLRSSTHIRTRSPSFAFFCLSASSRPSRIVSFVRAAVPEYASIDAAGGSGAACNVTERMLGGRRVGAV